MAFSREGAGEAGKHVREFRIGEFGQALGCAGGPSLSFRALGDVGQADWVRVHKKLVGVWALDWLVCISKAR